MTVIVEDLETLALAVKAATSRPASSNVVVVDDDGGTRRRARASRWRDPSTLTRRWRRDGRIRPRSSTRQGRRSATEGRCPISPTSCGRPRACATPAADHPNRLLAGRYLLMADIAEREVLAPTTACTFGHEVDDAPGRMRPAGTCRGPSRAAAPVPRIWEKLHAGVLAVTGQDPQQAETLEAALAVGDREQGFRARGEPLSAELAAEYEAHARRWPSSASSSASTRSRRPSRAPRRSRERSSPSSGPSGWSCPRSRPVGDDRPADVGAVAGQGGHGRAGHPGGHRAPRRRRRGPRPGRQHLPGLT